MRIGAATSVRDEAPYVVDWLAHVRALGIGTVFVAENDSIDGTDRLLAALADEGVLHMAGPPPADLAGLAPQRRAYAQAARDPGLAACDRVLVCDIDEYLALPLDDTLPALLDRLEMPDAVSFAWRMHGDSGRTGFETAPVTERFDLAARPDDPGTARPFWQVKTLFPPSRVKAWKIHRPRPKGWFRWLSAAGRDIGGEMAAGHVLTQPDFEAGALHHYNARTPPEFAVKLLKGYGDRPAEREIMPTMAARAAMNANAVPAPLPPAIAARARAEAARLRALPGIAGIEARAVARHRHLIDAAQSFVQALPRPAHSGWVAVDEAIRAARKRVLAALSDQLGPF